MQRVWGVVSGPHPGTRSHTLGTDCGCDTQDCVRDLRARRVTSHVARKTQHSAIDSRMTRHSGYAVSLRVRKRAEEVFGLWVSTTCSAMVSHLCPEQANQIRRGLPLFSGISTTCVWRHSRPSRTFGFRGWPASRL